MYGATNILFIVFAGIGALLAPAPLPNAIASGNVGTSLLIAWTELACLFQFANAIRWNRNIVNWSPGWCDFCTHFLIAADVAFVGSGVSINRRLYMIMTLDPRRHEKTFNAIVDAVLCLVIPLASIALEYVVQKYRYYIYEDIGCAPGVANVTLAFPLVSMIPLLVGTVSTGYACLTIRANLQRHHKAVEESGTSWAWSRRLMAIGFVSAIYGLAPTSAAIALLGTAFPVTPWPGWTAIHSTIGDVVYVPAQDWQMNSTTVACLELRRWTTVSLAFIIFVLLGLTADVKKMYRIQITTVVGQFFFSEAKCYFIYFHLMPSYPPTCSRTAHRQNTDENLSGQWEASQASRLHWNGSRTSLGKPRSESRQESLGLSNRPRLDLDLESIHLPQHSAVSRPTSPWTPHHAEGSCPT